MSTSDSSWRDLIRPDDPRYETWLLMRAFIQHQHNAATEESLNAFQKGSFKLADILKYFGGMFDGLVEPVVGAVTGTLSAEQLARNLDRASEEFLKLSKRWFPVIESSTGIDADSLETELKLLLTIRVAAWKKEAFRIAFENETSSVKTAATPTEEGGAAGAPAPEPEHALPVQEATWEEVEILVLSDTRVQTTVGGRIDTYNYREMGFQDRRSSNPSGLWAVLLAFARLQGTMPNHGRTGKEWEAICKRIERVRKALQKHFGISDDPLPYIEGIGYRARFKISRSPAADT